MGNPADLQSLLVPPAPGPAPACRRRGQDRASMGRRMNRIWLRAIILTASSALLAGCQFGGLNSLPLPGTAGHGEGAYSVTVEMADVATLPQNSPVMVDDVTVGSVAGIVAVQRPDGSFMPP